MSENKKQECTCLLATQNLEVFIEELQDVGIDDILNLEELTLEQMKEILRILGTYEDPEDSERCLMEYIEVIAKRNANIWKNQDERISRS